MRCYNLKEGVGSLNTGAQFQDTTEASNSRLYNLVRYLALLTYAPSRKHQDLHSSPSGLQLRDFFGTHNHKTIISILHPVFWQTKGNMRETTFFWLSWKTEWDHKHILSSVINFNRNNEIPKCDSCISSVKLIIGGRWS